MPSGLNPNLSRFIKKQVLQPLDYYVDGILGGDRSILGQSITLIESTQSAHQELAQQIINACLTHSGQSRRVGITGSPGVGKSTFIETAGLHYIEQGKRVAVLAIDPSSQLNQGSILGDKTRMEQLSRAENAFIRPSPAGMTLGGVAQKTRESIMLCEAAGFDLILVETVGVGQSEIAVHSMVDCFLLLLLPGAGDELQGIKRGIVEMADLVLINKVDVQNEKVAKRTRDDYKRALHLFPQKESEWTTRIHTGAALQPESLVDLWATLDDYFAHITTNDYLHQQRQAQSSYWLTESIQQALQDWFYEDESIKQSLKSLQQQVIEQQLSPFEAARRLLERKLR
ncbi:MAG: methylmalonyl Co-A mutase-associated GTPase MeaB [Bacteroidota bacterium]